MFLFKFQKPAAQIRRQRRLSLYWFNQNPFVCILQNHSSPQSQTIFISQVIGYGYHLAVPGLKNLICTHVRTYVITRIANCQDLDKSPTITPVSKDLAISVSHLTKKFGDFTAVDDISFTVKTGQIFAFLGPNGAGKSTTIKMLTTLLRPTSGDIRVHGHDPVTDQDRVRQSFGIVFQDPSLDEELTAYENMDFHGVFYSVPDDLRHRRIEELLNIVDLWNRRDNLVKTFSGGMRRRLEIARGLLHHPKIFFLDEPTLGLDPQTRNQIWQYILDLNKKENITTFFTTHYMEEADRIAAEVAVIDHGKIVALGSPIELKKKTKKSSLEGASLSLTGHQIREEESGALDHLRMHSQLWRGGRR